MASTRPIASSRVSDQRGGVATARPVEATGDKIFAAALDNATAIASQPPPSPKEDREPRAARNGGGAGAAVSPVTNRDDPGPAPLLGAERQPSGAAPPNTAATAQSPSTAMPPAPDPEIPSDDRGAAASGDPAESPFPAAVHKSRQSERDRSAVPDHDPRNPTIVSTNLVAGVLLPDPDALNQNANPSYWPQIVGSTANAAPPPRSQAPDRQRNLESVGAVTAVLMPGDALLSTALENGPAPPVVENRGVKSAPAEAAMKQDWPAPATGAGFNSGRAHSNVPALSRAGPDAAWPQANPPDAAADAAPSMLNSAPSDAPKARSTDVSGPPRLEPKLVDGAVGAGSKINSGDGPNTDFRLVPQSGDGVAPTNGAFVATAAAAAAATTAPTPPASQNSSNISAGRVASGDISDQLFGHLLRSIQTPDHDVVLRLHPPELGDLTVRVVVIGREVSAWFTTPQALVQQAISQAIGQLHADLGNAGYNLAGAWVGADASDQRERGDQLPPPVHRDGSVGAEQITLPRASPAAQTGSRVSIYV